MLWLWAQYSLNGWMSKSYQWFLLRKGWQDYLHTWWGDPNFTWLYLLVSARVWLYMGHFTQIWFSCHNSRSVWAKPSKLQMIMVLYKVLGGIINGWPWPSSQGHRWTFSEFVSKNTKRHENINARLKLIDISSHTYSNQDQWCKYNAGESLKCVTCKDALCEPSYMKICAK